LEFCSGGELFNRIVERGCFSEKEASRVLKELVTAVEYIHGLGIVHRDIKPENILFQSTEEGAQVKVVDFGLAKHQEVQGNNRRSLLKASQSGTTAYCAPERLNMIQESKAVDMWSVGCIMYFLLFGVPPFYSENEDEDEHDSEICKAVCEGKISFDRNRSISLMAQDLLMRLLEGDPTKRISAEAVLVHPWIKNTALPGDQAEAAEQVVTAKAHEIGRDALKCSINRVIDIWPVKQDSNDR